MDTMDTQAWTIRRHPGGYIARQQGCPWALYDSDLDRLLRNVDHQRRTLLPLWDPAAEPDRRAPYIDLGEPVLQV